MQFKKKNSFLFRKSNKKEEEICSSLIFMPYEQFDFAKLEITLPEIKLPVHSTSRKITMKPRIVNKIEIKNYLFEINVLN